jgi:hypothetical protein
VIVTGCGGLFLAGAAVIAALVAAIALDLGGLARTTQKFYSRMPVGGQSVEFYRIMAAVLLVIFLGVGVSYGPQIAQLPCR